jgi:molybdopterin molybdotransferase
MAMISVAEALQAILDAAAVPLDCDMLPLHQAHRRVLAKPLTALRTQPPFPASAMDGFALRAADIAQCPAQLTLIGQSAAGHGFRGHVGLGEAVRIFTGAPVPEGADTILIQENARFDKTHLTALEPASPGRFIRPAGLDFNAGETLLHQGLRLHPAALALAAAMGHAALPVSRKPRVGVLATGDELVRPGEAAGADQIIVSNTYAVMAQIAEAGGDPFDLGIAQDRLEALNDRIAEAKALKLDVLVTTGGASVGDHDLVQEALTKAGMALGFWTIAMRPGKPLMHGVLNNGPRAMQVLGLPGNPVSSIICAKLFLQPLIRHLLGEPQAQTVQTQTARLGADLAENDKRQDYLRATLRHAPDGLIATPFAKQDSSMLRALSAAEALIIRKPHAPAAKAGEPCDIIPLGD